MGCDACRNSQKVGMRPQSFSNGMKTGKALGTEYISSFRFSMDQKNMKAFIN